MLKFRVFVIFAIAMWVVGCSSSSTSPPSPTDTTKHIDTTKHTDTTHLGFGGFKIQGNLKEINTSASVFDTVAANGCYSAIVKLVRQDSSTNDTLRTTAGVTGDFEFDSLPPGTYSVYFSKPNSDMAPFALHDLDASQNPEVDATLDPYSWLKAFIRSVSPDLNSPGALDITVLLQSMRADKPPYGTVFLYMSTKDAINPADPNSYDVVYHLPIGNKKDSLVVEQIVPYLIHDQDGNHYDAGTTVYCRAYAEPYAEQWCIGYRALGSKKPVYPFLGPNPTSSVQIQIP